MEDAGGGANGDVLANLAAELALGTAACRQNRAEIWGCFFFSWRGKGEAVGRQCRQLSVELPRMDRSTEILTFFRTPFGMRGERGGSGKWMPPTFR